MPNARSRTLSRSYLRRPLVGVFALLMVSCSSSEVPEDPGVERSKTGDEQGGSTLPGDQPTTDGGLSSTDDGGLPPTDDGGLPPTDDGGLPPTDDGGLPPTDDGGLPPADDGGLPPPDDSGLPTTAEYGARYVPRSKQPAAGDTYVAPNGSGTACTQANPCALSQGVSKGGFVWLTSGTYAVTSELSVGGNRTLEALEPKKAIIDFQKTQSRLMLTGNDTTLRNIVVRHSNRSDAAVHVFGNNNLIEGVISENHRPSGFAVWCGGYGNLTNPSGGSFNTFKDCISRNNSENCNGAKNCTDSDTDGISISCGRGNKITHFEAHYNADDGIDVWRSYESTVEYSIASRSAFDPNDPTRRIGNGNGFKMGSGQGPVPNKHTFFHNWSHDNKQGDFSVNGGQGFTKRAENVCGSAKTPCGNQ